MNLQRFGRGRRGIAHATIVILALTQVAPGPAAAQVLGNIAVSTTTGAVISQRAGEVQRGAAETGANPAAPDELPPVSDIERQGYGCLIGGGTAAVLSAVGGATETVMIVAGGMLRPTNPIVLWTALAGTVIAAACAATALATPSVVRLWDYYHGGKRPAAQ